jgi:hypothetical protein
MKERDEMTTPQHSVPTAAQGNGQAHANPAEPSSNTYRDDPVPVSVLVNEAREAGVIDWLTDQISSQCGDLHSGVEVRRDGAVFRRN